jgi:hypothetical protein
MKENIFYNRVSSWIRSYRNPEALEWLRRFVDNSAEPADVKLQLYREIAYKETRLRQMPVFTESDHHTYLADEKGGVRIYATRFGAVCKLAELALKGFEVELEQQDNGHFRISLSAPAPAGGMNAAA